MKSTKGNCTQYPEQSGLEAPATVASAGGFFVTLTEDVHTVRAGMLRRGVHVLIDPAAVPKEADTVLVGDRLEAWDMQPGIRGVAIQYHELFR